MSNLPNSQPRDWNLPPNLARRWEAATDSMNLCLFNLKRQKGSTFRTSRPVIVFVKLATLINPGIKQHELNNCISTLMNSGVCYLTPVAEDSFRENTSAFVFYLAYDEEYRPTDELFETDPKILMGDVELQRTLEAHLVRGDTNTDEDNNPPVADWLKL